MSWDSDVAAEAVSEAAPAVDDASSDDEGDAPPGPPRSRRELERRSEALGRRRRALDALLEQYAIRDNDYARRLDALEAEAASTAARVAAEVKDSETDEAAADLLLAGELTRHADTRRTAELEGLELERVKAAITTVGKQRRLANARQVAAETITQGALVRAKTADEITRSLREASARDLLSHPDESEVWAADLERVLHHARGAKSPDPRGLTCVVCLCNPRNVAFFDCGHLAACAECADGLESCPLCRRAIRERRRIFFNDVDLGAGGASAPAAAREPARPAAPAAAASPPREDPRARAVRRRSERKSHAGSVSKSDRDAKGEGMASLVGRDLVVESLGLCTVVRHNKGGGVFASPSTHTVLCADGSSHDVVLQRVKLGELVGRPYHILEDAATPPPSPTRPPADRKGPAGGPLLA